MSRLRHFRETREMRREELAAAAGISYDYVRRLETDDAPNPTLDVARRIARALGVAVDEVFPAAGAAAAATGTEG